MEPSLPPHHPARKNLLTDEQVREEAYKTIAKILASVSSSDTESSIWTRVVAAVPACVTDSPAFDKMIVDFYRAKIQARRKAADSQPRTRSQRSAFGGQDKQSCPRGYDEAEDMDIAIDGSGQCGRSD